MLLRCWGNNLLVLLTLNAMWFSLAATSLNPMHRFPVVIEVSKSPAELYAMLLGISS